MKRRLMSLLLAGAMTATLFAGCGNDDSAPTNEENNSANNESTEPAAPADEPEDEPADAPEAQTLKVAAFEGGYGADMWTKVAEAFEASHEGVTVELTVDKKIEDVISPSMKAGDYPDVIHCATGREAAMTETFPMRSS